MGQNVTSIEMLKERIEIVSNYYGKIIGKPGQYVITVAGRKYLINDMWDPLDIDYRDRDSGYVYFNVYPFVEKFRQSDFRKIHRAKYSTWLKNTLIIEKS